MARSGICTCLGCGKQFTPRRPDQKIAYPVCGECAEIMQQGLHKEYFKVIRNLSKNLDSARDLSHKR